MKASVTRAVVGIAVLSLGLTGCGGDQFPSYSSNVKYGVRKDPILQEQRAKDLGEERYDPDRPGVLPIMRFDDIFKPDSPYHANASKIDDKILRDPMKIPEENRKELEAYLEVLFGTPANPKLNAKEAELDEKDIKEMKLDDATLAMGSTRYRVHCMHCHGVPGDGRGPTARWVNPHPRDFRAGLFKFQSVDQTKISPLPPSRADLLRTLRHGIEGTAMPAFTLLKDEELESLVSYVIFLSIRGKAEAKTIMDSFVHEGQTLKPAPIVKDDETGKDITYKFNLSFYTKSKNFEFWVNSSKPESAIEVVKYTDMPVGSPEFAESVKRGQQIFTATASEEFKASFVKHLLANAKDAKNEDAIKTAKAKAEAVLNGAKCVSCHTDYGRQARFKFDDWGTLVRPNNFTLGVFRGGHRPVDMYFRIHSGINGSGMTPFGKSFEGHENYIWDLVNFVSVVSYPTMRESLKLRID